jgi:hypothetical protein
MFEETAEKLLGASAKELGEMQQMAVQNSYSFSDECFYRL